MLFLSRKTRVSQAPCPDVYRGKRRLDDANLKNPAELEKKGQEYADDVNAIIQKVL